MSLKARVFRAAAPCLAAAASLIFRALAALEAAEASRNAYAFRLEYNDGVSHGTRHYFRALVTGLTYPSGGANDWSMVRVALKMISTITKVAAT